MKKLKPPHKSKFLSKNLLEGIIKIALLTTVLCFWGTPLLAQWEPEMRLTDGLGRCELSPYSLAADGNYVHLIWSDARCNGCQSSAVFYRRSIDGGATWGFTAGPLDNTNGALGPNLAVSGSMVHAVWLSFQGSPYNSADAAIVYLRSTDRGATWTEQHVWLDSEYRNRSTPIITADGNDVYVVWIEQDVYPKNCVVFRRSTDGGLTWSPKARWTVPDIGTSQHEVPRVKVTGTTVDLVWTAGSIRNVYHKRSTDRGVTWGSETKLSNIPESATPGQLRYLSSSASLGVSANSLYVVWNERRADSNGDRFANYLRRSGDGGATWQPESLLSSDPSDKLHPSLTAAGQNVHVVWADERVSSTGSSIFYKRSTDRGVSWGPDTQLSESSIYSSGSPAVVVSGPVAHVVWEAPTTTNITYRRNLTGNASSSDQLPDLDIFADREAVHGNVMKFVDDRSLNFPREPRGEFGPAQRRIKGQIKAFAMVNSSTEINPDPDGPSAEQTLVHVRAIGTMPSDAAVMELRGCLLDHPSLQSSPSASLDLLLSRINGVLVQLKDLSSQSSLWALVTTPRTLRRGVVEVGQVYVCVPSSTRQGIYVGRVAVGARSTAGRQTSDWFTVRVVVLR